MARVEMLAEGVVVDQQETRFGFRRIEAREGKLWLNGKPLFLMGFDRHEDSPRTGMAVDLENSRQDYLTIKDAGCNFLRLCHYPHHPGELEQCDELGLLVLDEIPLCAWGNPHPTDPYVGSGWVPSDAPAVLAAAERDLRKMILRDRNHPSVIIWSVSNENEEQYPEISQANNRLIQLGKELDPTRLVSHVSCHWISVDYGPFNVTCGPEKGRYFEFDDVICVNAYPAEYFRKGHRPGDNTWLEETTRWFRDELAKLHARYPEKPIIVSEFGYMSFQGVNGPLGEDMQALVTEAEFKGMDAPYVCGAALWCFAKHAWSSGAFVETAPWGYVSRDRRTKMKAFSTVKNMFKQRAALLAKQAKTA
jgi:beta-glucuronidase